ncbi:MAG: primosomal protein N' [Acidiferrobacterales bacterium]|nr:primosomal protein N' [Acidiferrobacterales bacterium]
MTTNIGKIYQVAVPVPLRRCFDYSSDLDIATGTRVLVPFGQRNLVGVVLSRSTTSSVDKIRPIGDVLDNGIATSVRIQALLRWASQYYHHPIGEVISAALPVLLRQPLGMPTPKFIEMYSISPSATSVDALEIATQLRAAPSQTKLFKLIQTQGKLSVDQLNSSFPGWRPAMKQLVRKELVIKEELLQLPVVDQPAAAKVSLTEEQQHAATGIINSLGGFRSFVLQGITGSGKTEVYLEAAKQCIAQGKQVLFLVPEISLTPQLVGRVRAQLGPSVYAMHSGMTDKERYQSWWMAKEGYATAILGTRSAVFTWLKDPGLIVVDEEHDQSYKQQDGFRYHARDLAIKRASMEDIPVVLGSATPSLESLHNIKNKRHVPLQLTHRVGKAKLPAIEIVDTTRYPLENGVSSPVLNEIGVAVERGEQVIVYINRRGYAPVVHCYECGWQAACQQCSARLTYHHHRKQFRCHHCGYRERLSENCPQCDTPLYFAGAGTQRVEQALLGKFPTARFCRLDRDQANTTRKLYQQLEAIQNRQVDIIVGTQLITKGHDFPGVSLVCVINADQGLFSADFRAPEFMFQQLLQVAGRAGRAEDNGKVLLQTAHPANPYIRMLTKHDYPAFAQANMEERQHAGYPPVGYFALLRSESTDLHAASNMLQNTAAIASDLIRNHNLSHVEVFSPVPSPMEKLAGRFRMQLLVRSPVRKQLHELLAPLALEMENQKAPRSVRWSIDVDPIDMG